MIGLTAGLVIEGHTGKSIPMQVIICVIEREREREMTCDFGMTSFVAQLEGYWSTIVGFFI